MNSLNGRSVAIYARFSSSLQDERSIEDQVRRCADFVRGAGGEVREELIYADMAISAASLRRPAFELMMAAVQAKTVDAIVVEDLSRVTRDIEDSAGLYKRLQYAGVALIGVADGIDTRTKSAKLTMAVKSIVADMFLEDLRDKTLRGLEGRCLAGYSTGGLPFGYRSVPDVGPDGRVLGNLIVIDEPAAAIVRRIFSLYLEGVSYAATAKLFNLEGVPYARQGKKFRMQGWVHSSVRAVLHNEAYVGVWRYKRRQWVKVPGTNTRRPKERDAAEVITQERPNLRIIDPDTWAEVQRRSVAVRAKYAGKTGPGTAPGNQTRQILSGLLVCGVCSGAMVIIGGSKAQYYACAAYTKRGTCKNSRSVREDRTRTLILQSLGGRIFTPEAVDYLRHRIVQVLGSILRSSKDELQSRSDALRETRAQLENLVAFIASGEDSPSVRARIRALEDRAAREERDIEVLTTKLSVPVILPTPNAVLAKALDLDEILKGAPLRAREALRRIFVDGRITMTPQPDGSYLVTGTFLPLVAVAETSKPPSRNPEALSVLYSDSCAGRI